MEPERQLGNLMAILMNTQKSFKVESEKNSIRVGAKTKQEKDIKLVTERCTGRRLGLVRFF